MEHRISATDLARRLGDVLARVRYRNDSFVVDRNGEPVARILPLPAGSVTSLHEAFAVWRASGPPDPAFAHDLERIGAADEPPAHALGLVIDTSALVSLERAGVAWETHDSSRAAEEEVVLPSIVYAELMSGVYLADSAERSAARRAKIDALTDRVPIVDLGPEVADRWALLFARLSRSGEPIPSNDLAVAATALQLGFARRRRASGRAAFPPGPRFGRAPAADLTGPLALHGARAGRARSRGRTPPSQTRTRRRAGTG